MCGGTSKPVHDVAQQLFSSRLDPPANLNKGEWAHKEA
jgi:hypothetical protein